MSCNTYTSPTGPQPTNHTLTGSRHMCAQLLALSWSSQSAMASASLPSTAHKVATSLVGPVALGAILAVWCKVFEYSEQLIFLQCHHQIC